jgi:hypothetical protein
VAWPSLGAEYFAGGVRLLGLLLIVGGVGYWLL